MPTRKCRVNGLINIFLFLSDQKLFKHKRAEQNEAVKTILGMPDAKKRAKLVDQLINTIHKVIGDSKVVVEGSGFTPGDTLPTEKAVRDGISQVLENAAFFAELALRFVRFSCPLFWVHSQTRRPDRAKNYQTRQNTMVPNAKDMCGLIRPHKT
jgi:hypothetical protein